MTSTVPDPFTVEVVQALGCDYTYAEVDAALGQLADALVGPEVALRELRRLTGRGYTPTEAAAITARQVLRDRDRRFIETHIHIDPIAVDELWRRMPLRMWVVQHFHDACRRMFRREA